MRKLLVLLLVSLFCLPVLASAEEGYLKTLKPIPAEREAKLKEMKAKLEASRQEIELKKKDLLEKRDANKEARDVRQEDRQEDRQEKRAGQIGNYVEKITERVSLVLKNLENLDNKLKTHLDKLASQGTDVTSWKASEAKLAADIAAAKAALADLPSKLATLTATEKLTVTEAKTVREAVASVLKIVKTIGQDLHKLVQEIRAAMPKPANTLKPSATEARTASPAAVEMQ
ncbi:MAG: hypothetical protein AAB364_02700 [Patescibacteria group bacterium]